MFGYKDNGQNIDGGKLTKNNDYGGETEKVIMKELVIIVVFMIPFINKKHNPLDRTKHAVNVDCFLLPLI